MESSKQEMKHEFYEATTKLKLKPEIRITDNRRFTFVQVNASEFMKPYS